MKKTKKSELLTFLVSVVLAILITWAISAMNESYEESPTEDTPAPAVLILR